MCKLCKFDCRKEEIVFNIEINFETEHNLIQWKLILICAQVNLFHHLYHIVL